MAARKTHTFLPAVFQTDTNKKFLSATMDQLVSEPNLQSIYGYIGRRFAPTFKPGDSYILEYNSNRQNYQLEPSVVITGDQNNITFFAGYLDLLDKIGYYGGLTNDQSRLFEQEYYTFDPRISYDKLVNFSQYYWLPDGPTPVEVSTSGVDLTITYTVTRDSSNGRYVFKNNGVVDNSIVLARGGIYEFVVDQPGYPFWIQTELGVDGLVSATPTISSRGVLGVENNGTDSGTVTFVVPPSYAQDRFLAMPTVYSADYATPIPYSELANKTLSQFLAKYPGYAGITGQLNGKYTVFLVTDAWNNLGETAWTNPTVNYTSHTANVANIAAIGLVGTNTIKLDSTQNVYANLVISGTGITTGTTVAAVDTGNLTITLSNNLTANVAGTYSFTSTDYDPGYVVPESQRYGVWRVVFVDAGITNADGSNDPLLKIIYTQDVEVNEKVYIKYGLANANKEYYKDYDGFFKQMPLITCGLDNLWIQDGVSGSTYTPVKIVDYTGWTINIETDILGKQNYTSPNGVEFTSGLKVQFGDDVTPASYQNRQFYVEQVGDTDGIRLVPVDELVTPEAYNSELALNYPTEIFPDYITINRASKDRNAWSRTNRWFHLDVILASAEYNGVQPTFDQAARGQRPIVQFECDLQLFNDGRVAKAPIDILDTSIQNAFTELQGKTYTTVFGIEIIDSNGDVVYPEGLRVIFGADLDPLVKNKIYKLDLVQYAVDAFGNPSGTKYIELSPAEDSDVAPYSTTVVKLGKYKGSQWWFDGVNWNNSQQKTALQQPPLFDVLDETGKSYSTYTRSTFVGTQLFGYLRATTGTSDSVLSRGIIPTITDSNNNLVTGFYLSYKNFQTQGDIRFQNNFNTDTFTYVDSTGKIITKKINLGFIQKVVDNTTLSPRNTWLTVPEPSRQYQQISYVFTGVVPDGIDPGTFRVDITPKANERSIPYLKVFKNFTYVPESGYTLVDGLLTLTGDYSPAINDQIDILVYSSEVTNLGFFQVPQNLDLNAQNIDIDTLTLGQLRNHLVAMAQNSTIIEGNVLGQSNLRDIDIKQQGGTILQHSAPIPYASLFLIDDTANFINALRYAQQEYAKFKNKFLELSISLVGIDSADPVSSVDAILAQINTIKNKSFPWYYSDMVPYGALKNIVGQIGAIDGLQVFDPLKTNYEITNIFNDQKLSNLAVLVYLNDVQLIKGIDYNFSTDTPSINFTTSLAVGDIIKIVEYSNTDGNFIPETPSKLGLWPRYIPEIFLDDTYRDPITVIRGHDGSITPAFGDYRDDFLLELEKRIYNNIKLPESSSYLDTFSVIPGKFRASDYSLDDITQLISPTFLNWVGNNKLDFNDNDTFEPNDQFTWNYAFTTDKIDGANLPGSWRACYQYFYDTTRPHITPWEMLGFSSKPNWWEGYYGPGPYTGGNKLLWDDLEAGRIRYGDRAGIDLRFARPGLSAVIPVDANGNLINPAQVLSGSFNGQRVSAAWSVGQVGPVEYAWRTSSDYPFAMQQVVALAKPAKYFGVFIDNYNYSVDNVLYSIDRTDTGEITGSEQFLTKSTNHHLTQTAINFNGDVAGTTVYRGAGYLNWIADYLINQGITPSAYITPMLKNFQVKLAYKVAGFTDQRYLQVLAEQVSPTSTNESVLIPAENYNVFLNEKPVPVNKLIYSSVIVEKTDNGYSVRGYDLFNSFFTIIPSVVNSNGYRITVLNSSATIFNDYQNQLLTVPYGYEFTNQQQVADFLISYERYLISQGFVFEDIDEELNQVKDWRLSVREFLYWAQQGWKSGSILVLSPVSNTLNAISVAAITAGIDDSQYGSKVLDQNFNLIKNNNYTVLRTPNTFKVSLNSAASVIGYVEVDLVQYEHTLVFDNTTVFNDVIYQPESGNRQYRLKLIGQRTATWDGSLTAEGYIYNSGVVPTWNQGKDYLKGDLVQYKSQYYTALDNVVASPTFQFQLWQVIAADQIQKGLLPNLSSLAVEGKSYYDSYAKIRDKNQLEYSHALIGFKNRQYLSDLGLTETTQIEFYKGFVAQKGSKNAVDAFTKANINNLTSNISLYEEWAMRVGEYGALSSNPFVEIALDERAFGVNPSVARFVDDADNNLGDGVSIFNKSQIYKSYGAYTANVALNRTVNSYADNDIPTAGYVNLDDVDLQIFDLANYNDLNNNIDQMGSGYTIWCAKDFTQDWNVYRITETNNQVIEVANSLNGRIAFTTVYPHNLSKYDVFLVKNFDSQFDGFYQVHSVMSMNSIMVDYAGNIDDLTTQEGNGLIFRLDSMRFQYMEDARIYGLSNPPNGWKVGDKIWIDDDAETTAVQGQPFGTQPSGTWKVYEKQQPWEYNQQLIKAESEYSNTDSYGTSVRMSADGLLVVSGAPTTSGNVGAVYTFLKNYAGNFEESFSILPLGANTHAFGSTVDLATTSNGATTLVVGAPDSLSGNGYVYVYNKSLNSAAFERSQIIVGNSGDKLGSSLAINQNGEWLYLGAPGNNTVYVYGLSRYIPKKQQLFSVNNRNTIYLSSAYSLSVNDVIIQPSTGARATVANVVSSTEVQVNTLTNFVFANYGGSGNVTLGNATVLANLSVVSSGNLAVPGIFPFNFASNAYQTTLNITSFIPAVTGAVGDPSSLTITSGTKTFVPNVEYTLSNSTITFTSPVNQSDISVVQQPYYRFITELAIPAGFGGNTADYGRALSSSYDGAQLAVGAPLDTVNVGVFTYGISSVEKSILVGSNTSTVTVNSNVYTRQSYVEYTGAGAVYVFDRVIEAFNSVIDAVPGTGGQDYRTDNPIAEVYKVTLDNVEVTNYTVVASDVMSGVRDTIRFVSPPAIGQIILVEVNKFNVLERLIGVDSLEGGLAAIQQDAYFGTSLTICSNNCAIYIGAPNYDNGTEYNSGAVWKFHNRGRLYGTDTGYVKNPTFTPGDSIRLNNFNVTATGTTLDDFVDDVNNANILGVTATNENGFLRLDSDVKVAKDQLRILSGTNSSVTTGILADSEMIVFAFMQIIVNPYGLPGEYFGSKVKLASNAYMLVIGSGRGSTFDFTTFDFEETSATTTFDDDTTRLHDKIQGSGSVYIYELYDDPRDEVENPGRYAYAQQLDPGTLVPGGEFGYSLDIESNFITVSAPRATSTANAAPSGSGTIYIFDNPTASRGWKLIRYQQPNVDIDSVSRAYLYDNQTNLIKYDLQFIDPAKGRILGQAEQDITFKTEYDPAIYNRGFNSSADINNKVFWGELQVGKVWWNLSKVRYIDYEQDTLTYRSLYWGQLFQGSTIEISEWVKSPVLPSEYINAGGDGTPLWPDDSAYVEDIFVDPVTSIITTQYYYWVKDRTTVDPNNETRNLTTSAIADYITNPKNQNIAYAAMIKSDAIAFYNVAEYLSADNTIMHLDHQLKINTDMIHSEYELVQKGNPNNPIPPKLVNKLVDSLAGIDKAGQIVPDPKLSLADRYGISVRPRQSMFENRLSAINEMVSYVNDILAVNPIVEQFNLSGLTKQDPQPNFKRGEYDQKVSTEIELSYIDTLSLDAGYLVLVENDTAQDGLWVLYRLEQDKSWSIQQVQAYKTELFWSYVDWYATGYSASTRPDFSVDTAVDAIKLGAVEGQLIFIRNATGNNTWQLVVANADGSLSVVGIQNGTIQLDDALGDFTNNNLGFGNQDFDSNRYDQNPNNEIRAIVEALNDEIFTNTLAGEFNKLFFVMVNYLLTEQNYVDWLFKSSFISITHKLRTLSQFPSYVIDNQTYYQNYIEEVKPYRTKIREYLLDYTGDDTYEGSLTDFDLPPYYDQSTNYGIFRSPSGEEPYTTVDANKWLTAPYDQWYNNRNLQVSSILIENAGANYVTPPTVTITNVDGNGFGANAIAVLDGNTGAISSITVVNTGSGYTQTPTVTINGSATTNATAYAVMKNPMVRSFDSKLKFDRTTLTSIVQEWRANTAYTKTEFDANGRVTSGHVVTHAIQDGNVMIRKTYFVNSNSHTQTSFIPSEYTVCPANYFDNANDRIIGYYEPTSVMPVVDVVEVLLTMANTSVSSNVIYVQQTTNIQKGMYIGYGDPGSEGTPGYYITEVRGNVDIVISNVSVKCTQIQLSNVVSLATDVTITARYDRLDQLVTGIDYPEVPVVGNNFKLNPLFGRTFDVAAFDPVQYSRDGIALLSSSAYEIALYSMYANVALGTAPEDIVTVGGSFVDTYHSRAPEELIPGIMYDTLDMRVYTKVDGNANILAYRVFDNMLSTTSYLRITGASIATLELPLHITDSNIYVNDTSLLSDPNPTYARPGVVFINGERITFYKKTTYTPTAWSANTAYTTGTAISNNGINYVTTGNVFANTFSYVNTSNVVVLPGLNILSQIRRGTQGTSTPLTQPAGSDVVDAGIDQVIPSTSNVSVVTTTVAYDGETTFATPTYQIGSDPLNKLKLSVTVDGNVAYPVTYNENVAYYENYNYTGIDGNIYQSNVAYGNTITFITGLEYGQVVRATANVFYSNVWYNSGIGSATDGAGFGGSTTNAVEFLRASTLGSDIIPGMTNALTTEDAINTITTETSTDIYTED